VTRGTTGQDTSSHWDAMSYLSRSTGSYDSMMKNDADEQYNSDPPQRVGNSVSVSGFLVGPKLPPAPLNLRGECLKYQNWQHLLRPHKTNPSKWQLLRLKKWAICKANWISSP
jgi:hypothetical protein